MSKSNQNEKNLRTEFRTTLSDCGDENLCYLSVTVLIVLVVVIVLLIVMVVCFAFSGCQVEESVILNRSLQR